MFHSRHSSNESARGETGTMEGNGGPEMTHGSKSSKSSKEDKNMTQIKPC